MKKEQSAAQHIQEAMELLKETRKTQLDYGCFLISLRALGCEDIHFQDILYRSEKNQQTIISRIERSGFIVSDIFSSEGQTTAEELEYVLSFKREEENPEDLVGFLVALISHPTSNQQDHAVAIIPADNLSPQQQQELRENEGEGEGLHLLINTQSAGGYEVMSPAETAEYFNTYHAHEILRLLPRKK